MRDKRLERLIAFYGLSNLMMVSLVGYFMTRNLVMLFFYLSFFCLFIFNSICLSYEKGDARDRLAKGFPKKV
jgi:hypothetical protein